MEVITRYIIDALVEDKESVLSKSWVKQEKVVSKYQMERAIDPAVLKDMIHLQMYTNMGKWIGENKPNIHTATPPWPNEQEDPAIAERYKMDYLVFTREELVELLDICVRTTQNWPRNVGKDII